MKINGKTKLVGLLGWPISHTFSPAMHNAAAAALAINWVYIPMPVRERDLAQALAGLPALGFRGVNVTVPHKQNVLSFLDEIEEGALAIGAVNTITIEHQAGGGDQKWRLSGTNTDWTGFLADLADQVVPVQKRECLVLGAGGSARAIVYALLQAGANVFVLARRPLQAEELVHDFQQYGKVQAASITDLTHIVPDLNAPLIVNCTPLGMTPHVDKSVWPDGLPFPRGAFAYDLVYNPAQTLFMRQAAAGGCGCSNGLGMLVYQGAFSFETWTNKKPDLKVMRRALTQVLS